MSTDKSEIYSDTNDKLNIRRFLKQLQILAQRCDIIVTRLDLKSVEPREYLHSLAKNKLRRQPGRPRKERVYMTTSDLAAKVHISPAYVRQILLGEETNPSVRVYTDLVNALSGEILIVRADKSDNHYEKSKLNDLTERQYKVLTYLAKTIEEKGYPPSLKEICAAFRFSSHRSARYYLEVLSKKNYIERDKGKARGIRLIREKIDLISD